MKQWRRLVAGVVLLVLAGCDEPYVITIHYDPAASFEGLTTYCWMDDSERVTADRNVGDREVRDRVVKAVDKALAAKGFTKAPRSQCNLMVGQHLGLNDRPDLRSMNAYYNYSPGWAWDYYHYARDVRPREPETPTMVLKDYGAIVVDLAIPAEKPAEARLFWRGTSYTPIPKNRPAKPDQDWFDERMQELLEKYPPQP